MSNIIQFPDKTERCPHCHFQLSRATDGHHKMTVCARCDYFTSETFVKPKAEVVSIQDYYMNKILNNLGGQTW